MVAGRSELQRCAQAVMEAVPAAMRFLRAEMRRHRGAALSVTQLRVLAFLDRRPGASLSGLAEHLGVTPPTASAIVTRLVRDRLVDRAPASEERRRVTLALTPRGAQTLRLAREATRAQVERALAPLPPARLGQIGEALRALAAALEGTGR